MGLGRSKSRKSTPGAPWEGQNRENPSLERPGKVKNRENPPPERPGKVKIAKISARSALGTQNRENPFLERPGKVKIPKIHPRSALERSKIAKIHPRSALGNPKYRKCRSRAPNSDPKSANFYSHTKILMSQTKRRWQIFPRGVFFNIVTKANCVHPRTILLHYITFYYIILHFITFYYILLHSITLYYILLHYITFHYILLHSITFLNLGPERPGKPKIAKNHPRSALGIPKSRKSTPGAPWEGQNSENPSYAPYTHLIRTLYAPYTM